MANPLPRIRPPRRIRVLWLIDSLTMGGAERLVAAFAASHDRERVALSVCCLKVIGGNPVEPELELLGVPLTTLHARHLRDLGAFRRLVRLIRHDQIDVIHTHLTYAGIWGGLAGFLTRRPVLTSWHVIQDSSFPSARHRIRELLARWVARRFSRRIIVVSNAMRAHYLRRARLRPEQVVTVHNGIALGRFMPAAALNRTATRAALGIPAEVPVLVTVAVLRPEKGHRVLLEAFARVARRAPEARWLIVGDGPEAPSLRQRVAALRLEDRVIFAGQRDDIPQLLASSDLFVLPSLHEAFPTAILEAMAMRLPVVATRVGGIPELVVDGLTGRLVAPEDPVALAQAIEELLTHPSQARAMGEQGRARVERFFSATTWARELEALYEEVVPSWPRQRVCLVEFAGRGGLIHYAYQLGQALAAQGAEVSLVTDQRYELADRPHAFRVEQLFRLWDPKPEGELVPSSAGPTRTRRILRRAARGLRYYAAWWPLIRYLRRERPDVVQFGDIRFATDLIPLAILRASGLRLADMCHNVEPFDLRAGARALVQRSWWSRVLFRAIYKQFAVIFVHAEANRREFLARYRIDPARVHVIPHGNEELLVELGAPAASNGVLRRQLKLPDDAPVALFFGTLSKRKGLEDLLVAFAEVRRSLRDARLLIAGFPTPDVDVRTLQRQAEVLGLNGSVIWHLRYIPTGEVAAWFALADVAVFPYRAISQSGALQAAYSFGKPVIATAVGGLPEVVEHGTTGLLVEPASPHALAEALHRILRDRAWAKRMGDAAHLKSQTDFAWDRVAALILQAYDGVRS